MLECNLYSQKIREMSSTFPSIDKIENTYNSRIPASLKTLVLCLK